MPSILGKQLSVAISHPAGKMRAVKSLLHVGVARLAISGIAFKASGRGVNCSVSSNKMKQQQQKKPPPLFFFNRLLWLEVLFVADKGCSEQRFENSQHRAEGKNKRNSMNFILRFGRLLADVVW